MSIKARRAVYIVGTSAAATLLVTSAAMAVPGKGPQFSVDCPGVGEFTVSTPPGQGACTPALVVDHHQVLLPYRIIGQVPVDDQVVDEFDDVKPAPLPADAITC